MKDKKVGDKIVFDYDVYDIEHNVEMVYDHTDTLAGIIKEVIPSDRGGHTKYKVKLTGLINVEYKGDYEYYLDSDEHTLEVSDNDIYRAGGLHDVIYQGMYPKPTIYQIERIIKMYDPNKDIAANMDEISHNWYKYGLEKIGLYDEEEFGITSPAEVGSEPPIEEKEKFWNDFYNKVMSGIK